MRYNIRIEGNPVPQGRPRATKRGDHVRLYDPAKSKEWKREVLRQATKQSQSLIPFTGPVFMRCTFLMPKPKSLPKKVVNHVKKPDLTNLIKGIEDALEGLCYYNDSQITTLVCRKEYSTEPGVDIEIVCSEGVR